MKSPGKIPVAEMVQLPVERVQPTGVPTPEENVTTLDGVFAGVVVSATVTVQVETPPILIEVGVQTTLVEVLSN